MKIKRWAVLLLTACLMSLPLLGGCEKEYEDLRDDKYITMVFTNTHYEEVESYAPEMKYLLGENDPSTGRMYAAGYIGPMLLTQSIEQMQEEVNMAFDMAEKFNIPVYFQLDDINNYTTLFGGGAEVKYWEDPSMVRVDRISRRGRRVRRAEQVRGTAEVLVQLGQLARCQSRAQFRLAKVPRTDRAQSERRLFETPERAL